MSGEEPAYTDLLIRISAPRPKMDVPSVEAIVDDDGMFCGGTLELDEQERLAHENRRPGLRGDPVEGAILGADPAGLGSRPGERQPGANSAAHR